MPNDNQAGERDEVPMLRPKGSPSLPLRVWRIAVIRKRGKFLGLVEAPDKETAAALAAKQFKLSDEQRERLIVQERALALGESAESNDLSIGGAEHLRRALGSGKQLVLLGRSVGHDRNPEH